MKLNIKVLIAIVLVCLTGIAIFIYNVKKTENDVVLETETPVLGDIVETITASGRLQPIDQVDIGTEVSGTVSKIFTDFNEQVKKGQILLEIDPLKAKVRVDQTKASYKSAENEMKYQKKTYERTLELFNKGSIAATELETAEYRYRNSQNSLINAKSVLEQAELDLANCTIRSPIDGIVLNRSIEAGQTVAASLSAPTLFTLAKDLTQMEVMADIDEADIGQVKTGQKVTFSVDAFPQDKFTGIVQEVRLSPNILSNVVTYVVVIIAENKEQKLLPGMTANCDIVVQEGLQVLTISTKALQFKPDENTPGYLAQNDGNKKPKKEESSANVWVLGNDGMLNPKRIKIGISDGTKVHVLEGLDKNSLVATGVQSAASAEKSEKTTNPFMPQKRQNVRKIR